MQHIAKNHIETIKREICEFNERFGDMKQPVHFEKLLSILEEIAGKNKAKWEDNAINKKEGVRSLLLRFNNNLQADTASPEELDSYFDRMSKIEQSDEQLSTVYYHLSRFCKEVATKELIDTRAVLSDIYKNNDEESEEKVNDHYLLFALKNGFYKLCEFCHRPAIQKNGRRTNFCEKHQDRSAQRRARWSVKVAEKARKAGKHADIEITPFLLDYFINQKDLQQQSIITSTPAYQMLSKEINYLFDNKENWSKVEKTAFLVLQLIEGFALNHFDKERGKENFEAFCDEFCGAFDVDAALTPKHQKYFTVLAFSIYQEKARKTKSMGKIDAKTVEILETALELIKNGMKRGLQAELARRFNLSRARISYIFKEYDYILSDML